MSVLCTIYLCGEKVLWRGTPFTQCYHTNKKQTDHHPIHTTFLFLSTKKKLFINIRLVAIDSSFRSEVSVLPCLPCERATAKRTTLSVHRMLETKPSHFCQRVYSLSQECKTSAMHIQRQLQSAPARWTQAPASFAAGTPTETRANSRQTQELRAHHEWRVTPQPKSAGCSLTRSSSTANPIFPFSVLIQSTVLYSVHS